MVARWWRDVAVGVVLELAAAARLARPSSSNGLVDAPPVPAPGAAIVEPELVVGIPVRAANPPAQVPASRAERDNRARPARSPAAREFRPRAPASRARRRRATESSRWRRRRRRSSSARCSRASRGPPRGRLAAARSPTVSSVLPESTTTISSAQATDCECRARCGRLRSG